MTEIKLKPCPFCGGEAYWGVSKAEDGKEVHSVICSECNTGIFRPRLIAIK